MNGHPAATAALGICVGAGIPVLLWGPPGSGKTSALRALAEAAGLPCEIVIASIREPSDFAGLPVVTNGEVRFAPPSWARRLAEGGRGLLVLDELSTAPPAVQAALLRVVLERVVGDLALPDAVSIVAAANPPEQAADGWDLSAPLANRFCHLDWPVDPRAVAQGFMMGFDAPPVTVLPDDWRRAVTKKRAVLAAFMTVRPMLVSAPPTDRVAAGRAWPSPRTWDMAAQLLAAAEAVGADRDTESALVRGAVGDGPGLEVLGWLVEMDLPDPELVLADPDGFALPTRGDRAHAILASVAGAVAAQPTEPRWRAGWRVLGAAAEIAPDIAASAAQILARCRPAGAAPPAEIKAFAPLLRDAGLLGG